MKNKIQIIYNLVTYWMGLLMFSDNRNTNYKYVLLFAIIISLYNIFDLTIRNKEK